ncbi:NADP-dependent 3-hydroxy acid dehydrogenase YdfG [Methanimicrococcus hongohii]|uniref:NADP-dependent 3-hydroxy acid dehydrogenase YdfG n=1 Tax=Methanimicrococcus hongohii TaxID=3028295 RepID=A0AA96V1Q3_9EURY|nr:SDR family oxidoreductase [Methanimicrococcus sp. Hf6]WNY24235.1 NADP-dependent 3-hydroxy acid dehydrogenase YdfG [Methanimicrococcus sp. Hf6]
MDTVLITGATGGIGSELSKIFAQRGYDLVLTARSEEKLNVLKNELEETYSNHIFIIAADLAKPDGINLVFNEIDLADIQIDILVNNAGFGDYGRFADADWEKQEEMIQVNILALMQMTKRFLPPMIHRKEGKILNIASVAAFAPGPYMSVYYASKAFVLSFSEAIATELKNSGVTVTAVCPGPTTTGFVAAAGDGTEKLFKSFKNADPKDVAEFAYKSLMKGKVVATPGFQNKLLAFGTRLIPKSVVRKFVAKVQGED